MTTNANRRRRLRRPRRRRRLLMNAAVVAAASSPSSSPLTLPAARAASSSSTLTTLEEEITESLANPYVAKFNSLFDDVPPLPSRVDDAVHAVSASAMSDGMMVHELRQVTTPAGSYYGNCPDLNYVVGPMHDADADGNGLLDKAEYVVFANDISGGYLSEMGWTAGGFTGMPLFLQETYLVLSCLCGLFPNQEWGKPGCCTTGNQFAGIRTGGTEPGVEPTRQEERYLRYVCGTMNESLERLGAGIVGPPTGSPVATDRPTASPSRGPTMEPTAEPSTKPTVSPTEPGNPTKAPTVSTGAPTSTPTLSPITPFPTSAPTSTPTLSPITPFPTLEPTPWVPGTPSQSPAVGPPVQPTTPAPWAPGTPSQSPVVDPARPPTPAAVPTTSPTKSPTIPTASPTVSTDPTKQPISPPTTAPSVSPAPSISSSPSDVPSVSSEPTTSSAPSRYGYTGEVPAYVNFVASLGGQANAEEIMEGETNQVKAVMEESLLNLSAIVIEEEFGDGAGDAVDYAADDGPTRRRRLRRRLIVENATSATVESVTDVVCPEGGTYVGSENGTVTSSDCLNFNNTILLTMIDEPDVDEKIAVFQSAMSTKIAEGWLVDNFDLEKALEPPKDPDGNKGVVPIEPGPDPLSIGAIVGIIVGIVACLVIALLFAGRNKRQKESVRDLEDDYDLERQFSTSDPNVVKGDSDGDLDPLSPYDDDDSAAVSADRSFGSQEPLLAGQLSSTAPTSMSPMPMLGETQEDDSEMETSIYSEHEEHMGERATTPLAAMAAASTLAAAHTPDTAPDGHSPTGSDNYLDPDLDIHSSHSEENIGDISGDTSSIEDEYNAARALGSGGGDAAMAARAAYPSPDQGWSSPAAGGGSAAAGEEGGGLSAGAAAAIGAAGAGLVAAGAYAATRRDSGPQSPAGDSTSNVSTGAVSANSNVSAGATSANSALDELDNAIETGNWGHVGAMAALLASQGQGSHKVPTNRSISDSAATPRSEADDGSASRSSKGSGSSGAKAAKLERARVAEVDRLVEAGDWQGVVLAAARFEADQTLDGESSFSASGTSHTSSRWTGSATSATTPRSMATTDQSASNISSQRGQAEIRAEVEALVRRVVPEEADNIDEMMTQFKGREEELVETLRRMQERAIASRARLAVQKSAKLEAKAKSGRAAPPAPGVSSGSNASGGQSVGSQKSELEMAIEAGNWQAVGVAAQRMSGELSVDEKARIRDKIQQSPAFKGRSSRNENYNLEALIEQGDWQGVIEAAKKSSETKNEEEEALAQADMWQEIANQTKQEAGQGPEGAGDAATWAIQRSLRGLDGSGDAGGRGSRTIDDVAASDNESGGSHYESSSAGNSRDI